MKIVKARKLDVPKYYGVWNGRGWSVDPSTMKPFAYLSPGPLLASYGPEPGQMVAEIPADGSPPTVFVGDYDSFYVIRYRKEHKIGEFAETPTPEPEAPKPETLKSPECTPHGLWRWMKEQPG